MEELDCNGIRVRTGGAAIARNVESGDAFESAVDRAIGAKIRRGDRGNSLARSMWGDMPARLWGSLANVGWRHDDGAAILYTFRAAGDLVAALLGRGTYIDWYCIGPAGVVDGDIAEALAREGWRPDPSICDGIVISAERPAFQIRLDP